jgi:hypothetical protein
VTDESDLSGLPPLDPDAGLIRRAWDAGDHIDVVVMTAAEALDEGAKLAERNWAHAVAYSEDAPDEMHVAEDGRPIAVYYSAAAGQQLEKDSE